MTVVNNALAPLLDRLRGRVELTQDDCDAVLALPQRTRILNADEYFIHQGDKPTHCCLLLDGFIVREKVVANGARQILAVHMRGDMVDLQNVLLKISDHSVRALTDAKVIIVPRVALEELAFARPPVGKALWLETLVDGSVLREWIANVGQRDARTRLAHLLCEFALRLKAAGLATANVYELPMNQIQLAETVGITTVHVNRSLQSLGKEGLIERDNRSVRIKDWQKLALAADFDPEYLHLPNDARPTLQ